ncbi:MAG TPA: Mu-like prophage major head subunit gpT family protein [Candidatus Binataceae bacterium]|nr:Mu-like prophage major head subunit gpT family protein [Candidatus Binataceae bacterium]
MEISAANLNAMFTGFDVVFQRGFEKAPSYYELISSIIRATSRQTTYPWLGRTTKFREWLGDRVIQALETHAYTVINRTFEDTVGIFREDIEDDTYGVYEPVIEQLGWDAKIHPDELIFGLIKNAVTTPANVLAYDGAAFFGNHNIGLANQGAQIVASNLNSAGGGAYWFLVDAARPIRPFIFQLRRDYAVSRMNTMTDEAVFNRREFRYGVDARCNSGVGLWQLAYASNQDLSNPANYAAAIAAIRGFKTDAGAPFGAWSGTPKSKFLVVPPSLEETARQLLHSEFGAIAGAAGAVAAVPGTNIWQNSATLIVSEYLS